MDKNQKLNPMVSSIDAQRATNFVAANPASQCFLQKAPPIEVTPKMIASGRGILLDAFQDYGLSWRTPGVDLVLTEIFQAMQKSARVDQEK